MPKKTNTTINGSDYFRVTATVGHNPDGSAIRKQFYGDSKREAERKRDEYIANINRGLSPDFDKALFGTAFKVWLFEVHKLSISLGTMDDYERTYRLRIKESSIAGLRLVDVRAPHVQAYYNELTEKGHSAYMIFRMHVLLTTFINYCLKADLIVKSPLLAVKLPQRDKQSNVNKPIPDADIPKFRQAANDNHAYFIFLFIIFSGLRIGECLSLTHKDIENDTIAVRKSVRYFKVDGKCQHVLGPPKTPESVRDVPILPEISPFLKAHVKREKEKHIKLGIPFTGNSILFSSPTCGYRTESDTLEALQRLCPRIGAERTTLHSLRHTFASICAKMGVPLTTTAKLMGHSDIRVTAKIYVSVDDEEKKKGIKKLSAYFND